MMKRGEILLLTCQQPDELNYEDEKPETVSNGPLAKSEKSETTSYEGMGEK
ncbi:hypothetical protein RvY_15290 [Ramazzottius varieornatus]|uniref:Uncharacterized protein n=1 Tax=Ramazzottius varieornatus TaxID=947166 RepID=A0A1D1W1A0_RAMVA|nr:hypothetical protein RvY_15290 [Ramazzottius varieornatus]